MIRELKVGDEERLEAFLSQHAATSMFLRSNLRNFGLAENDHRFWTRYCAVFACDEIVAVLGIARSGMLAVQAPTDIRTLSEFAKSVIARNAIPVHGITGSSLQVRQVLRLLSLNGWPCQTDRDEALYILDLNDLIVPGILLDDTCTARKPIASDFDLLVEWRHQYDMEALNTPDTKAGRAHAADETHDQIASDRYWILENDDKPVAFSGFNAVMPDMVQIGGVWTPPEHRNKGYARAVVAASLQHVRQAGTLNAVLFTDNHAAAAAYAAIGFQRSGDYAIVLFSEPFMMASS
jgi:RimJ/RimL family protein N-acetyltransferase